jgi:hypothetical protein
MFAEASIRFSRQRDIQWQNGAECSLCTIDFFQMNTRRVFIFGSAATIACGRRRATAFPGYAFVKSLAENMQHGQELATSFVPVLVRFDDFWQVAFETDRSPGGIVALYLPGAPNPWSGTVVFVVAEHVRKLQVPVTEALKMIRALGRDSAALTAEIRALQRANQ